MAVTFEQNVFAYRTDVVLRPRNDTLVGRMARRAWLLQRAVVNFDIVHYNFGQAIMPYPLPDPRGAQRLASLLLSCIELRELALLRRAGKGIVVTYQGDDARQGDYCLAHFPICIARQVGPDYYPPGSDAAKRRRIARFARYADQIFALNPDLLHVLPERARFMAYAQIDPSKLPWVEKTHHETPVVLHAPTHREAKGTVFLLEAVERLRAEGVPFELMLIEGLSHEAALHAYERADLLVDQLLAGWYGGLALELMAMGKPTIAYIREADLDFLPAQMRQDLPVLQASPATIYAVLKACLTSRRAELPELGRRSRDYALRWHNPLSIAAEHQQAYEAMVARQYTR